MLQVITLASIAAVVLTAVLFALAAFHEAGGRVAGPANSTIHASALRRSGEVPGQSAPYLPVVNLNVVLPVVPGPISAREARGQGADYIEGAARVVAAHGYHHVHGAPNRALAVADEEWRARLDVTA